jgi:hypothetical protein
MSRSAVSLALGTLIHVSAWAGTPSSFEAVIGHYEPVRLSLLADSTDGVKEHAAAIVDELVALQAGFSAGRAGVHVEAATVVEEQLPSMIAAAEAMASADTLEQARDAFYALSVPLVRWQEGRPEDDRPSVAYCSMYRRSWLQPGEEIGNPYGGMPRCGSIVSR